MLINEQMNAEVWNCLVKYHPYYRFEWFYIIQSVYKLKPLFALLNKKDGFALVGSFKTTRGYISMPFLGYSGYNYSSPHILNELKVLLREKGIIIDDRSLVPMQGNPVYVNSVVHIDDIEEYWRMLSSNTRNQIRKSGKNNFRVKIEQNDENIYSIYSLNMHRLGSPVHHRLFTRKILSKVSESVVLTIFDNNAAIGSMLCFYDDTTLYSFMASTLKRYDKAYANYFLYWEVIRFLRRKRLTKFDLGRSMYGSGSYRFKQKFKPINCSIRSGIRYSGSGLDLASKLWKAVPYQLTLVIGPILRKYLP